MGCLTPREPIPRETDEVASKIVDAAFAVHMTLGPGLFESVYEVCLVHELKQRGLNVERQVSLPVIYDNIRLDAGLRLDLVVENQVVVELKAVEALVPVHKARILTYLKLSGYRLGLLVNFNTALIKQGIQRIALCTTKTLQTTKTPRHQARAFSKPWLSSFLVSLCLGGEKV